MFRVLRHCFARLGQAGWKPACLRLGRRLDDSAAVGLALSNEGLYHIQGCPQHWAVDFGRLTPLLIQAIQDQRAEAKAAETTAATTGFGPGLRALEAARRRGSRAAGRKTHLGADVGVP